MTHCVWNDDARDTGIYRCRQCAQRVLLVPESQRGKVVRICKNPPGPCVHLGDSTRQQTCQTCAGSVRVKVFVCTIHGECTIGKKLDGVACCAGCRDYSPPS